MFILTIASENYKFKFSVHSESINIASLRSHFMLQLYQIMKKKYPQNSTPNTHNEKIFADISIKKTLIRNYMYISSNSLCLEGQSSVLVHPVATDHHGDLCTASLESTCGKFANLFQKHVFKSLYGVLGGVKRDKMLS